MRLVLGSGSPRRRELLEAARFDFEVARPEVDESPLPDEAPRAYVLRIALAKYAALHERFPGRVVLAADTTVAFEGAIFGKPRDPADAAAMLHRLAGKTHQVHTAVAAGAEALPGSRLVTTEVRFRPLDDAEIARYVATGEPLDKAGAYGIQGLGGALVDSVTGSYPNVVGLPLREVVELLESLGVTRRAGP